MALSNDRGWTALQQGDLDTKKNIVIVHEGKEQRRWTKLAERSIYLFYTWWRLKLGGIKTTKKKNPGKPDIVNQSQNGLFAEGRKVQRWDSWLPPQWWQTPNVGGTSHEPLIDDKQHTT